MSSRQSDRSSRWKGRCVKWADLSPGERVSRPNVRVSRLSQPDTIQSAARRASRTRAQESDPIKKSRSHLPLGSPERGAERVWRAKVSVADLEGEILFGVSTSEFLTEHASRFPADGTRDPTLSQLPWRTGHFTQRSPEAARESEHGPESTGRRRRRRPAGRSSLARRIQHQAASGSIRASRAGNAIRPP